jgi:ankyrin repeat protein
MTSVNFLSREAIKRSADLNEAIYLENCEVADKMIGDGMDVNSRNEKLREALHYASAVVARCREIKLLLRNGADPAARDIKDQTPIDWVMEWHQKD